DWIGEDVNGDDLPVHDGETEYDTRLPAWSPYRTHRAVDQRQLGESRPPQKGVGHHLRAAHLPCCARLHRSAIGAHHNVGITYRQECAKAATPRGGEESGDNSALASEIGSAISKRGLAPHPATGTARKLPCRRRRALHNRRNFVEGYVEHIVQHEG